VRRSIPRFEIVFVPPADGAPVVVQSTLNPDEATVLFSAELQRLLSDRATGELVIRRKLGNNGDPDVILRQQVASMAP